MVLDDIGWAGFQSGFICRDVFAEYVAVLVTAFPQAKERRNADRKGEKNDENNAVAGSD